MIVSYIDLLEESGVSGRTECSQIHLSAHFLEYSTSVSFQTNGSALCAMRYWLLTFRIVSWNSEREVYEAGLGTVGVASTVLAA